MNIHHFWNDSNILWTFSVYRFLDRMYLENHISICRTLNFNVGNSYEKLSHGLQWSFMRVIIMFGLLTSEIFGPVTTDIYHYTGLLLSFSLWFWHNCWKILVHTFFCFTTLHSIIVYLYPKWNQQQIFYDNLVWLTRLKFVFPFFKHIYVV